jgi:ribosomal protein L29
LKKTEIAEIKKIEIKSLKEKAKKMQEEVLGLILDKNMGKLSNLKSVKNKKDDLARVLTIIRQKETLENLEKEVKEKSE